MDNELYQELEEVARSIQLARAPDEVCAAVVEAYGRIRAVKALSAFDLQLAYENTQTDGLV